MNWCIYGWCLDTVMMVSYHNQKLLERRETNEKGGKFSSSQNQSFKISLLVKRALPTTNSSLGKGKSQHSNQICAECGPWLRPHVVLGFNLYWWIPFFFSSEVPKLTSKPAIIIKQPNSRAIPTLLTQYNMRTLQIPNLFTTPTSMRGAVSPSCFPTLQSKNVSLPFVAELKIAKIQLRDVMKYMFLYVHWSIQSPTSDSGGCL